MKPFALALIAFFSVSGLAVAHEGFEHIRGTVTQISDKAITIQTPEKQTKTLLLLADTTFQNGTAAATLKDLKVGDRVVIDFVMKGKDMMAKEVTFRAAPAMKSTAPAVKSTTPKTR